MNWYYYDGAAQIGPVAQAEMLALMESGVVRGETLVWKEGTPAWVPAGSSELGRRTAAVPPPLPRAMPSEVGAVVSTPATQQLAAGEPRSGNGIALVIAIVVFVAAFLVAGFLPIWLRLPLAGLLCSLAHRAADKKRRPGT